MRGVCEDLSRQTGDSKTQSASMARVRPTDQVLHIWKEPSNGKGCGPVSAMLQRVGGTSSSCPLERQVFRRRTPASRGNSLARWALKLRCEAELSGGGQCGSRGARLDLPRTALTRQLYTPASRT
ncbi:hypothetical protein NDU88_003446 [Pleurodeles waltl]|uniref:Uncharacterized protein n=1 Tax=Pleurodeles waltl TaxID=8319 RepID=A0AAV7TPS7_PLEWA|nr:hypothetical protein NDU88_003446 [Pleurodeles waltl]